MQADPQMKNTLAPRLALSVLVKYGVITAVERAVSKRHEGK